MTYEHKGKGKGGYCLDKKIFISHSSKDVRYVEKIIDLIVDMGVRENRYFARLYQALGFRWTRIYMIILQKNLAGLTYM